MTTKLKVPYFLHKSTSTTISGQRKTHKTDRKRKSSRRATSETHIYLKENIVGAPLAPTTIQPPF